MKAYSLKFNLIFKKTLAITLIMGFFVPNISLAEEVFADAQIDSSLVPIENAVETLDSVVTLPIKNEVLENAETFEIEQTFPIIEVLETTEEEKDIESQLESTLEIEIAPEAPSEVLVEKIEETEEVEKTETLDEISREEIIVKFKSGSVDLEDFAKEKDLVITETLEDRNTAVVVSSEGESVSETIENILENKNVEYAEPNYKRTFSTAVLSDPFFLSQWALNNMGQVVEGLPGTNDADINAPEAWAISEDYRAEIIVAVIDTGVDYTHPDLANQMWDGANCKDENGILIVGGCTHGYDFASKDTIPLPEVGTDYDFHGTHVAGIIGAEKGNSLGIAGVAPNVKIMALRFNSDVLSEVKAIDFARENGAHIINASYSGTASSTAEYDAIKRFTDAGGIFITAAANASKNNDDVSNNFHQFPSDYDLDGIISVASTDQEDLLSAWSNFGNKSVDVGAPGSNILSTGLGEDYIYLNGTSMSAPHAVGVASLVWGYNPELDTLQVKEILLSTGKSLLSLQDKTVTGKRIDAKQALSVFRPEILNLNFGTTTEGLVNISFNIRDGFAGLNARLSDFSYSTDDGLTWNTPTGGDESVSLSDTFRQTIKTTTATSSDISFVWNIDHEDTVLKESLLAVGAQNRFYFNLFDGATSTDVISDSFYITASSTDPEPEPEPEPEPAPEENTGGGGGGGGGSSSESSKNKKGDINSDNRVDILDFNSLMIGWGKKGETPADINDDGTVDILDFNILMINWK